MWRALSRLRGDLVCFVDTDTEDFSAHFVTGLLGPLVCEQGVDFVKGVSTGGRWSRAACGRGRAAGA